MEKKVGMSCKWVSKEDHKKTLDNYRLITLMAVIY
jgi:hypothetical protein